MASLNKILCISQLFSLVNYTNIPSKLEHMKDLSVARVNWRLAELELIFEQAAKIAPGQNLSATFVELSEEAKIQAQRDVVSNRKNFFMMQKFDICAIGSYRSDSG